MSGGVKATGNIKWTSDFWLETRTGWKVCKSKKPPLRILESAKAKHMRLLKAAKERALRRAKAMRLRRARILAARKKKWAAARRAARIRAAKRAAAARKRARAAARRALALRRAWLARRVTQKIFIGDSRANTKCINPNIKGLHCNKDSGNRGIRINHDHRKAGDKFKVYMKKTLVCAQRIDSRHGWGMRLRIKCTKPNIKLTEPYESVKVRIGSSRRRHNERCVKVDYDNIRCKVNAGDKGKRTNHDWRHANDRFHVRFHKRWVCARRLDSKGGWGMNLQIRCKRPKMRNHRLYIGPSGGNRKCSDSGRYRIMCKVDAGNRYKRKNRDHWNAGDRFRITTSGGRVCARRLDSRGGWGMRLEINCKSPRRLIPARRAGRPPRYWHHVYIGESRRRSNTRCVRDKYYGVKCASDAGNRGRRVNRDWWNANDRFHISKSGHHRICAKRLDSRGGWGMRLKLLCTRPRMKWIHPWIGKSHGRTKCVRVSGRRKELYCRSDAGNKYIRINGDHRHANDRFHIYLPNSNKVCARRDDAHHGWGMHLRIKCQSLY